MRILTAIDLDLGRLDATLMSEEAQIEAFFDNCKLTGDICDDHGNINFDVFERDAEGKIAALRGRGIGWQHVKGGSPNFEALPSTIQCLSFFGCALKGTVQVSLWPHVLRYVNFGHNRLQGGIVTKDLPKALERLEVQGNNLSGLFEVPDLPRGIRWVDLSRNNFSGTFHLNRIPSKLERCLIKSNAFTGILHVQFPQKSLWFDGEKNQFTALDVQGLSHGLERFYVQNNSFEKITIEGTSLEGIRKVLRSLGTTTEVVWKMEVTRK